MSIWKIIVYPFGLAFLGYLFVSWAGMFAFGPDAREWLNWQNQLASALGCWNRDGRVCWRNVPRNESQCALLP